MSIVVVLRGPCGGGKTEIAKRICKKLPNFKHIEIDNIKEELSKSVSWENSFEAALWFNRANNLAHEYLREDKNVILDEVFSDFLYIE